MADAPSRTRFGSGIAALVYASATLALGWPALVGRFLVGPDSDQYVAGYAFRQFAARFLRETGGFPQWNPYQFGGMPYIAAMHGDIFYPTFILRLILPTDVAMTWGFMLHVFLAGWFTYLFLRRAGYDLAPALIGGLAYMMSGHIATYVHPGHDGKLFVSALFPLLLWSILALVRDGRRWGAGAIALVVGMQVLSPHPQLLQYSLLAGGAYALFVAVRGVRGATLTRRDAVRRLAIALGAVAVGLAIGAVQFLPVREYVAWSPRATGIGSYERATSFAKNPPEIVNAYVPEFTGILDHYWGANGIHFQGDYAGVVVLILAGAGLLALRGDRKRSEILFWAAATLVALFWALGAHTPFFKLVYYLVPGTKYFRAPDTVFFVGTLGIAVLAARGSERAIAGAIGRRYLIGWIVFGVAVALLGVSGALTDIARTIAPEQRVDLVDANAPALMAGTLRSLLVVLLTAGAVVWLGRRRDPVGQRGALVALVLLLAADLWVVNRQYWTFSPPASVLYAADSAIDYLADLREPGRALALPLAEPRSVAEYSGSGLMVHDVRNVFGYHGNELGRYNTLVGIPQGGGPSLESVQRVLGNPNVRRLTNLQYILTNSRRIGEIVPGVTQVAGPAIDDTSGATDYVYKLPDEAPFAWVAPVIVKAPDDAVLATVLDPRFDVTRAALFDSAARGVPGAEPPRSLPPATGVRVMVERYRPGAISLVLDRPAPAGSALIASENYYPGWRATVDGRPAAVARAQYVLMGVPLPAGARRVDLSFEDPAYDTGKVVTLLALVAAAAALAWGMVVERRTRV